MKQIWFNLLCFSIIVLQSCNDSTITKKELINNSTDSSIVSKSQIDSSKINSYWASQNIESATLYIYTPEVISEDDTNGFTLIINDKGELNPAVVDSIELDKRILAQIKNLLIRKREKIEESAECFIPRHGIVFKDSLGKTAGHLSICFECSNYQLRPKNIDYLPLNQVKRLFQRLNLPIDKSAIYRHKAKTTTQPL